jgi:hypothetical protein
MCNASRFGLDKDFGIFAVRGKKSRTGYVAIMAPRTIRKLLVAAFHFFEDHEVATARNTPAAAFAAIRSTLHPSSQHPRVDPRSLLLTGQVTSAR